MTGLWRRITSWFAHPLRLVALGLALAVGAGFAVWSTAGATGHALPASHRSATSPPTNNVAAQGGRSAPTSTAPAPAYAAASGQGPQTPPAGSTTSTPPASSVPTATTAPAAPPCASSAFVPSVSTDKTIYTMGEPVTITTTITNTGPACTVDEQSGFTCPGALVDDASGNLVWTSTPQPSTGCPARSGTPTVLPSGWTQRAQYRWDQNVCTTSADCTGAQVPPGQYRVVGTNWNRESAPVTVSITSGGPPSTTTTT